MYKAQTEHSVPSVHGGQTHTTIGFVQYVRFVHFNHLSLCT
jgi:hypothetical protein